MGIALEELLDEVEQDLFRLSQVWETFRYLFARDKKHVDILNAVSGGFFVLTQQLLFDDAILRVSKLTDPAGNKHQENMSLELLLGLTEWEANDPAKWQTYRARLDTVDRACRPCRDHRNKRISHKALHLFTKAISIHDPMMKMIEDAREAIHAFVHDIRIDLGRGSLAFDVVDAERDAEKLIEHLANRAAQKSPDAVSIITYNSASRDGQFFCAFCGERRSLRLYRGGRRSVEEIPLWHWKSCHGIVGFEQLVLETVDLTGSEPSVRLLVDLRSPASL